VATGVAPTIFISANELSGEAHAAHLATALQQLRARQGLPPAILQGNGSTRMEAAGIEILSDVTHMGALGIVHIVLKTPLSLRVLAKTVRHILRTRPQMVILVDSRVFHLRLAAMLRKRGYRGKIVYYVAPVRWESLYDPSEQVRSLSNPRFLQLRKYCDYSLLIAPVSLKTYEQLDIPHRFIGHPSCELVRPQLDDAQFAALVGDDDGVQQRVIVGALTGSRSTEVNWIAPHVFRALRLMREALAEEGVDLLPVAPVAHPDLRPALLKAAREAGLSGLALLDSSDVYELMARADLMIVKSGTGLQECVMAGAPAVMCYRIPEYLAWFMRHIKRFSMPFYGFPNLLAGREVVPELIQEECSELRIAEVAGELLFDANRKARMRNDYRQLRAQMCPDQGDGLTPLQRGARELQRLLGR
jgi:lipid-A-disaccharide synthase